MKVPVRLGLNALRPLIQGRQAIRDVNPFSTQQALSTKEIQQGNVALLKLEGC